MSVEDEGCTQPSCCGVREQEELYTANQKMMKTMATSVSTIVDPTCREKCKLLQDQVQPCGCGCCRFAQNPRMFCVVGPVVLERLTASAGSVDPSSISSFMLKRSYSAYDPRGVLVR